MNYKIQTLVITLVLVIQSQSSFGMYDYAEIVMQQPEDETSCYEEYSPAKSEFPKEFEEKLSRRYLHSLPDRADILINRRNGCLSTLLCYGFATCLVATVDVDTGDHTRGTKSEQKKSP